MEPGVSMPVDESQAAPSARAEAGLRAPPLAPPPPPKVVEKHEPLPPLPPVCVIVMPESVFVEELYKETA